MPPPGPRGNFCNSKVEQCCASIDTTMMSEASGMCGSTNGKYLYVVNDSPGMEARIFAFEKTTWKRTIIEISGITQTGFNPDRGRGYGDWEAAALGSMPNDPRKKCIIVADIGHNAIRSMGGSERTPAQQTRFIYVEEPTDDELTNFPLVVKPGVEFPIQYTNNNLKYDAESMAVSGDSVWVITKNKRSGPDKRVFVYSCLNNALQRDRVTTMECIGEMTISFSEVTDAFASSTHLALRTYESLNFYLLSDLRRGKEAPCQGFQDLHELKRCGAQEAMAYEPHEDLIYLLGEGSPKMFCLPYNPGPGPLKASVPRMKPNLRVSIGNFWRSQPEIYRKDIEMSSMKTASGMCMSSSSTHFFIVNDSVEADPCVIAFHKTTMKRTVIEITGITQTGFNPNRRGIGYGDWEAVTVGRLPNSDKRCIIIGDIGHSKGRKSNRAMRTFAQQTRLIYVEEPTDSELASATSLSKVGREYPIQYTNRNWKLDAESLAVVGESVYIITKNPRDGNKKAYVYEVNSSALQQDRITTMECKGEMVIPFSEVTDAFATPTMLALRTYFGINFYALSSLSAGRHCESMGYQELKHLASYGAQEAMAYDASSDTIYLVGEGSSTIFGLRLNSDIAGAKPLPPSTRSSRKTSSGWRNTIAPAPRPQPRLTQPRLTERMSNGNFCNATHQLHSKVVDVSSMQEASGLAISSGGNYFYAVNDSPEGECCVFALEKTTMKRTVIEVTGVLPSGFNANRRGEGFGDWEAVAVATCPQNYGKKCIVIADIGHNKVRDMGGRMRTDAQQTRFIYVEEPTERELAAASVVTKPGRSYPIQYTPKNLKYDAESLAVCGDTMLVVTKNVREGDKRSFVYGCRNDALQPDKLNTLELKGEMTIGFSEVTDAFATGKTLALRTYQGINFYLLKDLHPGKETPLLGFHDLRPMAMDGAQEAMAYCHKTKTIYLLGEGSTNMYSLQLNTPPSIGMMQYTSSNTVAPPRAEVKSRRTERSASKAEPKACRAEPAQQEDSRMRRPEPSSKAEPKACRTEPTQQEDGRTRRVEPSSKAEPKACRAEPTQQEESRMRRVEPLKAEPKACRTEPTQQEDGRMRRVESSKAEPKACRAEPTQQEDGRTRRIEPSSKAEPKACRAEPTHQEDGRTRRIDPSPPARRNDPVSRVLPQRVMRKSIIRDNGKGASTRTGIPIMTK